MENYERKLYNYACNAFKNMISKTAGPQWRWEKQNDNQFVVNQEKGQKFLVYHIAQSTSRKIILGLQKWGCLC